MTDHFSPKPEPSRGEQFRAAIILIELSVLLLAIVARNLQPPPLKDYMVYANHGMVFVADQENSWTQTLFPLADNCRLHWNDGTGEQSAGVYDMAILLDTGDGLPAESSVAFAFQARTLETISADSQVTLKLDSGAISLWTVCPPPPEPKQMAVYALDNTLILMEISTGKKTPLMPLREQLLWSSTTSVFLTLDALPAYMDESGAAWLPDGAELVGIFSSATPVEVLTLDKYHVLLRTSGEDIVLLSY